MVLKILQDTLVIAQTLTYLAVGLMTVLTVLHTLWVTVTRTTRIQVATHCTTTCTQVVEIRM